LAAGADILRSRKPDVAFTLISGGANVNPNRLVYKSPIDLALKIRQIAIAITLLKAGTTVNKAVL
jgi:hypothetical protein